ncbi:pitrilysin family protein [Syntrophotalea acetylenica]|uniref:M16 family metallopeptidase n=1 Tax=Syntrophotalea acetylenica TaxID=29542 RepID=UPI002A363D92|nr:pitrilysin family protein [Syntrophotalea acetylenica]MDY0261156.1 pitrilysin family protein [Syntrophotalea acetylenica]
MSILSGWRRVAAFFLCFLWVSVGQAQPLAEKVREHVFANGLRLLVVERSNAPIFTAHLTVGVGSVDETNGNRGVAHFLEHLRFKGTKTLGTRNYAAEKPLLEAIEETGETLDRLRRDPRADQQQIAALETRLAELQHKHQAFVVSDEASNIYARNGGVGYNAFTSKDLTSYVVSLPSNKLELWAAVESDRMANTVLREFYTERQVILEERRRSYDGNPRGLLYEHLLATAFIAHPYRHPIIGWSSDIENLSPADVRGFMDKYYAPANTVIALVGDVDFDACVDTVGRYFGHLPAGTVVPPVATIEPVQRGERRVEVVFDAQPMLAIAYHKPTLPAADDYVFDVIDLLLGYGRTSQLYQRLVVEKQLAADVATYGAPGARYPNLFVISVVPRYPHTVEELEKAVYQELERFGREPVSETDLDRIRRRLQLDQLRSLQDNDGLARTLTHFQTIVGDWRYLTEYDRRIAAITPADVSDVVRRYLTAENRTVAVLKPKGQTP